MKQCLLKFFNEYLGNESADKLYLEFENWFDYQQFNCGFPSKEKFSVAYSNYLKHKREPIKIKMITTMYSDRVETTNTDGILHSFNGQPSRVWISSFRKGTKEWHHNGMRHRIDGPAIEKYDGTQVWIIRGKRENPKGHAVVNHKLGIYKHYIEDKFVTPEEFYQYYGPTMV